MIRPLGDSPAVDSVHNYYRKSETSTTKAGFGIGPLRQTILLEASTVAPTMQWFTQFLIALLYNLTYA